jgi:hypothetical protein
MLKEKLKEERPSMGRGSGMDPECTEERKKGTLDKSRSGFTSNLAPQQRVWLVRTDISHTITAETDCLRMTVNEQETDTLLECSRTLGCPHGNNRFSTQVHLKIRENNIRRFTREAIMTRSVKRISCTDFP